MITEKISAKRGEIEQSAEITEKISFKIERMREQGVVKQKRMRARINEITAESARI
ncbi:MAG: hypothetical protein K0R57_1950 [Paenibacillaceae bacterium]|jgi:hypothetical protein|nr:hypothetical protein [Paenibacillaceae bacterium]